MYRECPYGGLKRDRVFYSPNFRRMVFSNCYWCCTSTSTDLVLVLVA
jgi:hypothetical protein